MKHRRRVSRAVAAHDPEKWRRAFDYANRSNAIEGLPPPSELGLQVQQQVIEGGMTIAEGIAILVKHYMAGLPIDEGAA